jgi:hypothetical protein
MLDLFESWYQFVTVQSDVHRTRFVESGSRLPRDRDTVFRWVAHRGKEIVADLYASGWLIAKD